MEGERERDVRLLSWLESSGRLSVLREQCSQLRTRDRPQVVSRLCLDIDPLELLQFNAELGDLLLHFPRQFWQLAQRVCFTAVSSLNWLPSLSSPSQLLLELRLTLLPSLPGYTITRPSDFPPLSSEPRFLSVSGVVVAASLPTKYTQSACFHCPVEGCAGASSHYIKLHVAGSSETATVRPATGCQVCGSPLSEDLSLHTLADKMLVHLVPPHCLQNYSASLGTPSCRQQATPIIIRGELCEGVRVGGVYNVIGVPVHSLREASSRAFVCSRLEANNVFHIKRAPVCVAEAKADLPTSVTDILSACSYSPWAFSATLAYSFAAELAPPGAHHRLKLAMLLSLASCSNSNPLHLLAVSTNTSSLPSLLLYGSSLASRSTQLTSTSDLWGHSRSGLKISDLSSVTSDPRREGGEVVLEGGALLLGSGGVCVAGDLSLLNRERLDRLQQTLERSCVGLTMEGGRVQSWPLSCAVWALSPTTLPRKALADCMRVVVFCDPPTSSGAEFLAELTMQQLLEQAMGTSTPPPLSHSHLHQLLAVVAGLEVRLGQACQTLLRSFYLTSRRLRASSLHGSDMPLNALDVMSGLAEAHARLSLRTEAVEEDGVVAILLYEETLVGRYGNSVLSLIPAPHFTDTNLSAYIGREFDQQMRTLHKHILQFSQSPSSSSQLPLLPEE